MKTKRKAPFVLTASDHGPMIVNRLDYRLVESGGGYGVGYQLLEASSFDPEEVDLLVGLLRLRRQYFGDGVFAIDCGANIGVHTIEWAKEMTGWGGVLAFEAQERIYYALAGNVALNNCFNARAVLAAVAAENGTLRVPRPNYQQPGSFGSLELRQAAANEFIGQQIDYSDAAMVEVRTIALDSLGVPRVDLIKIDVEGMEAEVLAGARGILTSQHPVLLVEWIKASKEAIAAILVPLGYTVFEIALNLLAVHNDDRCLAHIKQRQA
ncbi:MAG TPA: FkbM family methyltransferase [Stellaceae bacterium]|nr:FkbM family methyltransferase [Stellaceae bacterium]